MNAKEALEAGYKCLCMGCNTIYKEIPTRWDDGVSCAGGELEECEKCGCDLFMSMKEYVKRQDGTYIEPEDPDAPIESRIDILDL